MGPATSNEFLGINFDNFVLEDQISITQPHHEELSLWITFLKQWNGLSFFNNNLASSPVDIQLLTDAASSVGFGGFCQGPWFASP